MEINAEGGGGQKALAYFYSEMDFSVPESLHGMPPLINSLTYVRVRFSFVDKNWNLFHKLQTSFTQAN